MGTMTQTPSKEELEALADAVLNRVKHFTVGFGKAGDTPAAKGSGVLIKHGDHHFIVTCAHVEEYLRKSKQPVGLVRFDRSPPAQNYGTLNMNEVVSHVAGEHPWTKGEIDIAFLYLPPHLVGNIAANGVFLNAETNTEKSNPVGYSPLIQAHSVFGLVEDFTGATTQQHGRATTMLKGVLTSGLLREFDGATATLECFEENLSDLPASFGGTSGGGLWRVLLHKRQDGSFEAIHHRLLGIASNEDTEAKPPRITCQGVGRLDAMLEDVLRGIGQRADDKPDEPFDTHDVM
jgi:hypothetical protein